MYHLVAELGAEETRPSHSYSIEIVTDLETKTLSQIHLTNVTCLR